MTLQSQGRSRERILLFGMEGTGKSEAAKDIAARVYPNKLFVIDNDNAWDRMLEGPTVVGEEVQVECEWRWDAKLERGKGGWVFDDRWTTDKGNIWVYHADGWVANTAAIESIVEEAGPDDWVCIDSGSSLWDDVQAWFTEQVFDANKADYFMQVRLEKAKANADSTALGALDGWVDWPVINAQYKDKVMRFLVTPPCHLIVTAEQAEVSSGQVKGKQIEDAETRAMYGAQKVKPRGQKRMGHNMQTVIQLRRGVGGDFKAYTVKDRGGRVRLEGEDVTGYGFSQWYLEEVGGWQDGPSSSQASPDTPSSTPAPKAKTVAKKGPVAKGMVAKS